MNIKSTAYTKYMIFDMVIQRLCIIGRSPNTSPLVQSGDMSHPASTIAGETITVRNPRIRFSPAIILFIIFLISSSCVFLASGHGPTLVPSAQSAYHTLAKDSLLISILFALLLNSTFPKNPTIPTSTRRKDVTIFLNIVYVHKEVFLSLHHKFHFFANVERKKSVYSVFALLSASVSMRLSFFMRSLPESGMTTVACFMRASRLFMRVSRRTLFFPWRIP